MLNSIAARGRLRPYRGKAELQRGDAAPGAQKITFCGELHPRWTRGMIRGDEVDRAIGERRPELFLILALADGRRAFKFRCAAGNFLGDEGQVMRAGLNTERKRVGFALAQLRQRIGGRKMDDMSAHTK